MLCTNEGMISIHKFKSIDRVEKKIINFRFKINNIHGISNEFQWIKK
jgi:hypothetical protein